MIRLMRWAEVMFTRAGAVINWFVDVREAVLTAWKGDR